jgi:hypothetical protein
MNDDSTPLPVVETAQGEEGASCSPTAYVSNEELAVLAAMRRIRQRGLEIRSEMAEVASNEAKARLQQELDATRDEWSALNTRREAAYVRKMVMLGHLPPDALDDLDEPE